MQFVLSFLVQMLRFIMFLILVHVLVKFGLVRVAAVWLDFQLWVIELSLSIPRL
jgi:hypothetical protein